MTPQDIRATALAMVQARGLINLDRLDLCQEAGIKPGSFQHLMGCTFSEFVEQLRDEGAEGPDVAVSNKARTTPELRKDHILRHAVTVACAMGYANLSRRAVSKAAGVSAPLVTTYFGTIEALRREVVKHAIAYGVAPIIAQALLNQDPDILGALEGTKQIGRDYLANQ